MAKLPTPTESEVLRTCLALLRALGIFCWRANVGAISGTHNGKRRFVRFGMPGSPDILGVLPDGRFIGVETKRKGKRPTKQQIEFMKLVNKTNGVAFWIDDPRILETILEHVVRGASVRVDDDGHITVET